MNLRSVSLLLAFSAVLLAGCQTKSPSQVAQAPAVFYPNYVQLGISGNWTAYRNEYQNRTTCSANTVSLEEFAPVVVAYGRPAHVAYSVAVDRASIENPTITIGGRTLPLLEPWIDGISERVFWNRDEDDRFIITALGGSADFTISWTRYGQRSTFEYDGDGFRETYNRAMRECGNPPLL